MATRRNVASEKAAFKEDATAVPEPSNISPAVPTSVIMKLLAFAVAMVILPIGSFYLSVDTIFGGNSTFAGALAAVVTNLVLVGYVVVAMKEDQGGEQKPGKEAKKDR